MPVQRSFGSVLFAHLLNSRAIAAIWPDSEYIVLQASNMMWTRIGMEARVRALGHSVTLKPHGFKPRTASQLAVRGHPFAQLVFGNQSLDGSSQHEGSFYPLSIVLRFAALLTSWFKTVDQILSTRSSPEEYWLQAFALNIAGLAPQPNASWLCLRLHSYWHEAAGADLVAAMKRADHARCHSPYASPQACARSFAVKPVARKVNDPAVELLI